MVSWMISRAVVLLFGTLYPAYYSYKAVKTKNVKEYVRWMMYWIVFALYTVVESVTDISLSWFPLYYEIKIAFVVWLLSPYTRGASLIYRKFLHPLLSSKEREIDDYIVQAKERSYETMVNFGKQSLTIAATAAVSAAVKGQGAITERLRSFSVHDLTDIPGDDASSQLYPGFSVSNRKDKNLGIEGSGAPCHQNKGVHHSNSRDTHFNTKNTSGGPKYYSYERDNRTEDDGEAFFSEEETVSQHGLRRSQSVKSARPKLRKEPRYGSLKLKTKRRPALNSANYEI